MFLFAHVLYLNSFANQHRSINPSSSLLVLFDHSAACPGLLIKSTSPLTSMGARSWSPFVFKCGESCEGCRTGTQYFQPFSHILPYFLLLRSTSTDKGGTKFRTALRLHPILSASLTIQNCRSKYYPTLSHYRTILIIQKNINNNTNNNNNGRLSLLILTNNLLPHG